MRGGVRKPKLREAVRSFTLGDTSHNLARAIKDPETHPNPPVQRHLKFSAVLGTRSLKSSIVTLPTLKPDTENSRKTLGRRPSAMGPTLVDRRV